MSYFDPQEQLGSMNELPHLLLARFHTSGYGNVRWTVQCPYDGKRPCGINEPCTEHHEPSSPTGPEHRNRAAWRRYDTAHELWAEDHPNGAYHPGVKCWYEHVVENNDEEPEYYLAQIPDDTPVMQAMRVQVGHEGYDDECNILLKPWKD